MGATRARVARSGVVTGVVTGVVIVQGVCARINRRCSGATSHLSITPPSPFNFFLILTIFRVPPYSVIPLHRGYPPLTPLYPCTRSQCEIKIDFLGIGGTPPSYSLMARVGGYPPSKIFDMKKKLKREGGSISSRIQSLKKPRIFNPCISLQNTL